MSELSDISEVVEKPAKRRKLAAGTRNKRKALSDDEDKEGSESDASTASNEAKEPRKKTKTQLPKRGPAPKVAADSGEGSPLSEINTPDADMSGENSVQKPSEAREDTPAEAQQNDEESEMSDVIDESPKRKPKSKKSKPKTSSPKPAAEADDESEMSEVIDEPPKRKRKSKDAQTKGGQKSKAPSKAAAADQSPDDALIKQLQAQLVKCGVRKIWGFELKKYGDDKKAKIRHLKGMLTDIGMTGRFSEARAREIKERRELEADIAAVKEGAKNWGVNEGRPVRRRLGKSLKESADEDDSEGGGGDTKAGEKADDGGDDSNDDEEAAKPKVHGRGSAKYREALAFLGDDSDSD